MKVLIINGPNLNLLEKRDSNFYGELGFDDFLQQLRQQNNNHSLDYFQSNHCGELIDKIHDCIKRNNYDGIIINAGGYSHSSIALADATAVLTIPLVEVHLSNIYAREPMRQKSLISSHATAVICGMKLKGYEYALNFLTDTE